MQADTQLQNQCLAITKEIKNNPLSYWFREPFRAEKHTMDEYFSIIHNPMDLTTIQDKLENNMYANFEAWASDMDLIFENAITYNTPESLVGGIGEYLRRVVNKKVEEIRMHNSRNYENRLFELIKAANKILENPPPSMKAKVIHSKEISSIENFSKTRIEQLIRSLNTLLNDGKLNQILEVLKNAGEEVDLNGTQTDIDLAGISRKALHALEKFVKK
ncbi:Bromodomain containing protein [Histomonas meleagridis]|uniref:Bromodomain containing protein n=1 Tax=Histomonas meleagridis TaxID=135588 RepID=UPI00355AB89F|nr:Bromodomain containing protein [Histomonas meleagridis]KAH0807168.1 Bromodomain containing protein [Histomonas meleagridis]